MTDNRIKEKLAAISARQEAGELMPCPRCGRNTMRPELVENALSRYADVYVCSDCGLAEAMLDFMKRPLPLAMWAIFSDSAKRA